MKLSLLVVAVGLCLVNAGPKECGKGNRHLRRNRSYRYHYEGVVESGIQGTTEKASKLRIKAEVSVEHVQGCEYVLTLSGAKLEESSDTKDAFILSAKSQEAARELSKFPLKFTMDQGLITDIRPALKERQKNILNIKRGILSTMQIRWAKQRSGIETDVSGICQIKYEIERWNGTMKVVKTKDMESCRERSMAHASIETTPFEKVSSIYDAYSSCEYKLRKKNEMEHVFCKERYLLKPFSTQMGAGSYVESTQKLTLRKSRRVKRKSSQFFPEYYTSSLLFEHKHEEAQHDQASINKVKDLLNQLVKEAIHSSKPNTANIFSELVFTLRLMDERGFGALMARLQTCMETPECNMEKLKAYWSFFYEALAQCGTTSSVNILSSMIMSNKVPEEKVDQLISSMSFVQEAAPEMIITVMGLHKRTSNPGSLLLLGTLMHKLCKHRPSDCSGNAPVQSAIRNAEFYLLRILGNDCSVRDSKRARDKYYALRAIGNAGRPHNAKDIILDCIRNAAHLNVSVAALHALRRMPKDNHVKEVLQEIMSDRNIDTERRMEAFLILMNDPIEDEIILAIDMVHDEQEAGQLRSFIHSYVRNAAKNRNPERKSVTEKFKSVLASKNMTTFDPPAARFSKTFEQSSYIDFLKIGGGVKAMMFFHPESYVPRTIRMGLSGQALGHNVDFLEIDARLEGLEIVLERLFSSQGVLSKDFIKKVFSIPEKYSDEDNLRKKRSRRDVQDNYLRQLDNQVNIKESTPQALLSIKVFGNDIQLLTLEDLPFLNGNLEKMNIIELLHSLSKGKQTTFRRSVLFMEGAYVVPTIVGLPLSIQLNGSSVVTLNVQGKVNVKNMLFGPKKLNIDGSIQPSATVEISGKMMVDAHFTKIGVHVNATTFSSTSLGGKIEYEEGKIFLVNINVPEKPVEIFNYTHQMFQMVGNEEKAISGSPRRTETDLCADEVYSSTKLFGVDVCTDMSFPISYHNIEAPFYPLTGPVKIGFRLLRRDPLLKTYRLVINKKNDVYHVKFGTPGTQYKREHTMDLGVTVGANRGVVGATFGQSKRGALLRYEYDNSTHGVKGTIISNLTQNEVVVTGHYFNTTDPATLDRNLGLTFKVKTKGKTVQQMIYFEDTYAYWAFWWKTNFGTNKEVAVGFKVQYQPQIVEVILRHQPSKSDVIFKIKPSFPVTAIEIASTMKGQNKVNATITVDLKEAKINSHSIIYPGKETMSGEARWIRTKNQQGVKIEMSRNKNMYALSALLNYRGENKVFLGELKMKEKTHFIRLTMKKNGIDVESNVNDIPGRMNGAIINNPTKKSLQVDCNLLKFNGKIGLNYQFNPQENAHSLCINTTVNKFPTGICATAFNRKKSKGLQFTVLTAKGNLETSISNSHKRKVFKNDENDDVDFGVKWNGQRVFRTRAFRYTLSGISLSALMVHIPTKNVTLEFTTSNGADQPPFVDYDIKVIKTKENEKQMLVLHKSYTRFEDKLTDKTTMLYEQPIKGNLHQWIYEQVDNKGVNGDMSTDLKISHFGNRQGYQVHGSTNVNKNQLVYDGKMVQVGKNPDVIVSQQMLTDIVARSPATYHATYTLLLKRESKIPMYLTKLSIATMGRSFIFNYDPTVKMGHVNFDLADKGSARIDIRRTGDKIFELLVSYKNSTWNMGTITMRVSKDPRSSMWKVNVAGPELIRQQVHVWKLWQKAKQDLMKTVISKLNEVMMKLAVPDKYQKVIRPKINQILNSLNQILSTPIKDLDLSKLVMGKGGSLLSEIKTGVKENIAKALDLAVDAIFKSSLQSDYKLSPVVKRKIQVVKNLLSDLGSSIISLNGAQISALSRNLASTLRDLIKDVIKSPETKQLFRKALIRNIAKLNLTKSESESIRKSLTDIDYSKIFLGNQDELIKLWTSLIRTDFIVKRHQFNAAQKQIISLLTVKSPKVLDVLRKVFPESQFKVARRAFNQFVEILRDWRFDLKKVPAANLLQLFTKLKTITLPKTLISDMVPFLIEKELEKVNVPNILKTSIIDFVKNKNYVTLFQSILRLSFQKLNITGNYDKYVKAVMETDNIKALDKVAALVVENSQAQPELRKPFVEYLKNHNTEKLFRKLFELLFEEKSVDNTIRKAVLDFIATRNLTDLSREVTVRLLHTAKLSPKVKQLLHRIVNVKSSEELIKVLLHSASQLSNSTRVLDKLVRLAQSATGIHNFISTFYEALLHEAPLPNPLRSILLKFGTSRNFANLVKNMYSFGQRRAFSKLNITGFDELPQYIKSLIIQNMKRVVESTPERWRNRIQPVFNAVKIEIERFEYRKMSENATKVVLELLDRIYGVFETYVSTKLVKDLGRDAKDMVQEFGRMLTIGNSTAIEIYNRTVKLIIDRSLLGLRMLAQLLPSQVRTFHQRYINGKTINYKRIYQDFRKTDFTSQLYMKKVNDGFNRLATKILMEMRIVTGDFSSRITFWNLLKFINGLNATDTNSFIRSYNKIKSTKSEKLYSLETISQWKKIAKSIGKWKIGTKTVDELLIRPFLDKLRKLLPKIVYGNTKMVADVNLFFYETATSVERWNSRLQYILRGVSNKVEEGFSKHRKLYTFLSDLTIPMIGGAYFATRRLPMKYTNMSTMNFQGIKQFKDGVKEYDQWKFLEDIWSFVHDPKKMDTEKSLKRITMKLSSVVNGIHQNLLKKIKFTRDRTNELQIEIDNILKAVDDFLRKKEGKPLWRIAEKAASHIKNYYEKMVTNSTIEKRIMKEFAPMIKSVRVMNIIKSAISNSTRKIKETMKKFDLSGIEKSIRASVPAVIKNATFLLKSSVIKSLKLVDNLQKAIANNPFLANPKQYLQNMPGTMMKNITKEFNKIRPIFTSKLNEIERALKGYISTIKSSTEMYLGKMQTVIDNITSHLTQADTRLSKVKLMIASGFMKHLGNYSRLLMGKTNEYNAVISKQFEAWMGKKTSAKTALKLILINATAETKNLLETVEKTIKVAFGKFADKVIETLQKQAKKEETVESKIFKLESLKNLTGHIEEAKKLSVNFTKTVESSVIKVIHQIKYKLSSVKVLMVKVLSNWTTILNQKYALVKRYAMIDQATGGIRIAVPYVDKMVNLTRAPQDSMAVGPTHYTHHSVAVKKQYMGTMIAVMNAMKKMDALDVTPYAIKAYNASLFGITYLPRALEQSLLKYHAFLAKLDYDLGTKAVKMYKKMVFLPLKRITSNVAIEAPVDRLPPMPQINSLLGQTGQLFKPLPRTAILYENHVFTFDGNYVIIPTSSRMQTCTYLLARDFRNGTFTLFYSYDNLILESGHSKVSLSKSGKVEISDPGMKYPLKELPTQTGSMIVSRSGPIIKIQSVLGFQLFCNMDIFLCNFTVSGIYHNKTLGLFGTNNVEYADDLRVPDGHIATEMPEFVAAWEISRQAKCQMLNGLDFTPTCRRLPSPRCRVLFKDINSTLAKAFSIVNPYPYMAACEYETSKCEAKSSNRIAHCPVVKAYMNIAATYKVKLDFPNECALCKDHRGIQRQLSEKTTHNDLRSTDIVVIMRDALTTKKALKNLQEAMKRVDRYLDYSQINRRYSLVGFGGSFYRQAPYTQTGNGKVFGDISDLIQATKNLQLKNRHRYVKNFGLDALKYASGLRLRPTATKIFILVDNYPIYSGALQEMMEANALLQENGIILNVINKYRFKRNVIGKDSANKRYHMKIPKGETLRNIAFPPADDYLPIVKETRGAVMTIKGLMSSNEKWMKAFPISLNSIIQSQIRQDKSVCKTCICRKTSEGFGYMSCRKDARATC